MVEINDALIDRITKNVMRRLAAEDGGVIPGVTICPATNVECTACGLCVVKCPDEVQQVVAAGADRIGATIGAKTKKEEIAYTIDHTYLKPDTTAEKITELCREAKEYNFASVCINPSYVSLAAGLLKGSPVKITTVIGFPLGATTSTAKAMETRDAVANGADEIDMVMNIGALKAKNYDLVQKDIAAVVNAASGKIVKVILETALLTQEEKVKACRLAKAAGANFVKTSTGFGGGGATVADITLMRRIVGPTMGVKASGGIRTFEDAQAMIKAGATRIGASASVAIVKGEKGTDSY
jgi:deoxyribose-phosphate aldolase